MHPFNTWALKRDVGDQLSSALTSASMLTGLENILKLQRTFIPIKMLQVNSFPWCAVDIITQSALRKAVDSILSWPGNNVLTISIKELEHCDRQIEHLFVVWWSELWFPVLYRTHLSVKDIHVLLFLMKNGILQSPFW